MTLIHTLDLPGDPAQAWRLLVEQGGALRLAPGLTVGAAGRGTLRIVLGGHSVTYRGYARQHVEEDGRHVTWTLSGKEVRGTGRAHAEIRARFKETETGTGLRLTVLVEGRGRLGEVAAAEQERALLATLNRFGRAAAGELRSTQAGRPARGQPAGPQAGPRAPQTYPMLEVVPPAERPPRTFPLAAALGAAAAAAGALAIWRWRRRR